MGRTRKLHRLAKRNGAERLACPSCKFEFKCSGWDGCPSFLEQAKDDRVSNALCSQFKGKTCGKDGLKCCEDDLHEWVEDRAYGGYFPILPIPLEACLHDPNDDEWKGCDACEATFEIVDTGSRWPAPTDFTQEGKQLPAPGPPRRRKHLILQTV